MLCSVLTLMVAATPLSAPVRRVTTYDGRARVVRVAHPALPIGIAEVSIAVPALVPNSVRAIASGAIVLRVGAEQTKPPDSAIDRELAVEADVRALLAAVMEPLDPAADMSLDGWDRLTRYVRAQHRRSLDRTATLERRRTALARRQQHVVVQLRVDRTPIELEISYFVDGVTWAPEHFASLDPESGQLTFETRCTGPLRDCSTGRT